MYGWVSHTGEIKECRLEKRGEGGILKWDGDVTEKVGDGLK